MCILFSGLYCGIELYFITCLDTKAQHLTHDALILIGVVGWCKGVM